MQSVLDIDVKWWVRLWLAVLLVAAGLTLAQLLSGCRSIQTSDCARRASDGLWICVERP